MVPINCLSACWGTHGNWGTEQQDTLVLVIPFQSLFYYISDCCTEALMDIQFNGTSGYNTGISASMHCFHAPCHLLLLDVQADSITPGCPNAASVGQGGEQ